MVTGLLIEITNHTLHDYNYCLEKDSKFATSVIPVVRYCVMGIIPISPNPNIRLP